MIFWWELSQDAGLVMTGYGRVELRKGCEIGPVSMCQPAPPLPLARSLARWVAGWQAGRLPVWRQGGHGRAGRQAD